MNALSLHYIALRNCEIVKSMLRFRMVLRNGSRVHVQLKFNTHQLLRVQSFEVTLSATHVP